ncbi:MAG: UDP-N-acetylmuramate dehydrogenase [Candidatus Omnitrophica bacterium]|jgi:UDP-N-acetylmuramate dehydrogenase|nr:UDP-N-acetylmuramate dehydrogenase [Candidatus Omnitrophota bacterium]
MNSKKIDVRYNVSLRDYTTIKIGGKAKSFFEIHSPEELLEIIKKTDFSFYLLGNGSNILVKDGIILKPVVKLSSEFNYVRQKENDIEVGASTSLAFLLKYCLNKNLGGLEGLIGIPATLGGLLAMNASSFETSIFSCLKEVDVVDRKFGYKTLRKEDITLGYRFSSLKDYVILKARFNFAKNSFCKDKASEFIRTKIDTQDLGYPSCGCIFKNPPNFSAGLLIDSCHLKGLKRGDAKISYKHANFIINLGAAKYRDVDYLIKKIKETVYQKYKVELEEEIERWI